MEPEFDISKTVFWSITAMIGCLIVLGVVLYTNEQALKTNVTEIIVHKTPTCNCCIKWIDHLQDAGFKVISKNHNDLSNIKSNYGVAHNLRSCHTAIVNDYVIEGHVPAEDIKRMLLERPEVIGLAVPGMPKGSPGMEHIKTDSYDVLTFDKNGQTEVYASY